MKSWLMAACQWLDQNLGLLFTKHLPKNPQFTEIVDGTIPHWLDWIVTTEAMENYAKKLITTIPVLPDNAKTKFAQTPIHNKHKSQSQFVFHSSPYAPLKPTQEKISTPTTTASITNDTTNKPNDASGTSCITPKKPSNLTAILKDIECSLQIDLTELFEKVIQLV